MDIFSEIYFGMLLNIFAKCFYRTWSCGKIPAYVKSSAGYKKKAKRGNAEQKRWKREHEWNLETITHQVWVHRLSGKQMTLHVLYLVVFGFIQNKNRRTISKLKQPYPTTGFPWIANPVISKLCTCLHKVDVWLCSCDDVWLAVNQMLLKKMSKGWKQSNHWHLFLNRKNME